MLPSTSHKCPHRSKILRKTHPQTRPTNSHTNENAFSAKFLHPFLQSWPSASCIHGPGPIFWAVLLSHTPFRQFSQFTLLNSALIPSQILIECWQNQSKVQYIPPCIVFTQVLVYNWCNTYTNASLKQITTEKRPHQRRSTGRQPRQGRDCLLRGGGCDPSSRGPGIKVFGVDVWNFHIGRPLY